MENEIVNKLVGAVIAVVFVGCGKGDKSLAKQVGSKVGETLTDFASGVGEGVDNKLIVKVELSEDLTKDGVSQTSAKPVNGNQGAKAISIYFVTKKPLKSKLIAQAKTKAGQEIGRSVVDVDFAGDDAKYVKFEFPREMDTLLVDKYVIDVKK